MDEYTYAIECDMCGVETEVKVIEEDEKPLYCPMCGTECEEIYPIDNE